MARRPKPDEEVLSWRELSALRERLQMMRGTPVQDFYRGAHIACRNRTRALSKPEKYSGARSGLETDAEVALIFGWATLIDCKRS